MTDTTIKTHLGNLYDAALVAESLIGVIVACGSMPNRSDLVIQAAEDAEKIIQEICRGLDSVELDKVLA